MPKLRVVQTAATCNCIRACHSAIALFLRIALASMSCWKDWLPTDTAFTASQLRVWCTSIGDFGTKGQLGWG